MIRGRRCRGALAACFYYVYSTVLLYTHRRNDWHREMEGGVDLIRRIGGASTYIPLVCSFEQFFKFFFLRSPLNIERALRGNKVREMYVEI